MNTFCVLIMRAIKGNNNRLIQKEDKLIAERRARYFGKNMPRKLFAIKSNKSTDVFVCDSNFGGAKHIISNQTKGNQKLTKDSQKWVIVCCKTTKNPPATTKSQISTTPANVEVAVLTNVVRMVRNRFL